MNAPSVRLSVESLDYRNAPSATPVIALPEMPEVREEIVQVLATPQQVDVSHDQPAAEESETPDHSEKTHHEKDAQGAHKKDHKPGKHKHGEHGEHKDHKHEIHFPHPVHPKHEPHVHVAHAPHQPHVPHKHVEHLAHPKHEPKLFETIDEEEQHAVDALFGSGEVLDLEHQVVVQEMHPHHRVHADHAAHVDAAFVHLHAEHAAESNHGKNKTHTEEPAEQEAASTKQPHATEHILRESEMQESDAVADSRLETIMEVNAIMIGSAYLGQAPEMSDAEESEEHRNSQKILTARRVPTPHSRRYARAA